jgi:hypothetical protein
VHPVSYLGAAASFASSDLHGTGAAAKLFGKPVHEVSEVDVDVAINYVKACYRTRDYFGSPGWEADPHSPQQVQRTEAFLRQVIPPVEIELKKLVKLAREMQEQQSRQRTAKQALAEQQARENKRRQEAQEVAQRELAEKQVREVSEQTRRDQEAAAELTRQAEIEKRQLDEAKKIANEARRERQAAEEKLAAVRAERQAEERRMRDRSRIVTDDASDHKNAPVQAHEKARAAPAAHGRGLFVAFVGEDYPSARIRMMKSGIVPNNPNCTDRPTASMSKDERVLCISLPESLGCLPEYDPPLCVMSWKNPNVGDVMFLMRVHQLTGKVLPVTDQPEDANRATKTITPETARVLNANPATLK